MGEGVLLSNFRDLEPVSAGISTIIEQKYIPLSLARTTIENMTGDMENMKKKHQELIYRIDSQYKKIEEDTQSHYLKFISELKVKYNYVCVSRFG